MSGTFFGEPWNWAEMALRVILFSLLTQLGWRLVLAAVDREWFPQHPAARDRQRRAQILAPVLARGVLPDDIDRNAWRRATGLTLRTTPQLLAELSDSPTARP